MGPVRRELDSAQSIQQLYMRRADGSSFRFGGCYADSATKAIRCVQSTVRQPAALHMAATVSSCHCCVRTQLLSRALRALCCILTPAARVVHTACTAWQLSLNMQHELAWLLVADLTATEPRTALSCIIEVLCSAAR